MIDKRTEYQIVDKEGIPIGRFSNKEDREKALMKFVEHGFKRDVEV